MYLERISIYGFKTFQKETEVLLSPKISCIVGPNGSGKSNIVDAMRWALGEHRLTLLRASEATDLIFSGSAFKKPLGVASVKLIFNNEDRSFSGMNTPRVMIERRIYRSRESGYFVNNNPMRLQDVMSLFYSAGMYNHMYSIVGQGRIEEILLAKPEQKRTLIEQVAGVEVFKKKRKEALKKLDETGQNLLRVKDILSELKKNAERIINESKKAHMYYFLNDRLKQLESTLMNYMLTNLKRQIETVKSGILDTTNEEKTLLESAKETKSQLETIENKYKKLSEEISNLRGKKEKSLIEEAKLKEREIYLEEHKLKIEQNIRENNLIIEKNKRKVGYIESDLKKSKIRRETLQEELKNKNNEISTLSTQVNSLNKEIGPLIEKESKVKTEREKLREERLEKERALSSARSELNFLKKEKGRIEITVKNAESEEIGNPESIKKQIENLLERIDNRQKEKNTIGEEIALLKYRINEIKNFIREHGNREKRFKEGTLGSTLKNTGTNAGIEDELNTLILDNFETLKNKRNGHFFIKENVTSFNNKTSEDVKPILSFNSPFLQGIYMAGNVQSAAKFFAENAEKLFIKKIITKDGFMLLSPFEVKINSSLLLEEKQKELKSLMQEQNDKINNQKSISEDIKQSQENLNTQRNKLNTMNRMIEERNKILMQRKKIASLNMKIAEILPRIADTESDIERIISRIKNQENNEFLSQKKKKLEELTNILHNKMISVKDTQFNFERRESEVLQFEQHLEGVRNSIARLERENKSLETDLTLAKQDIFSDESKHNKLNLDIADITEREKELKKKIKDVESDMKHANVGISRVEEQKENILKKIEKQHVSLAEKSTQAANIIERLREKGIKEREVMYIVDEKKIKIEIASVKAKIQSLGAIDFTSVGEEENIKEELSKKENVYNDVVSSKKELEAFIKEMESRTHEEFEKTLTGVEKSFSVFFRRMFKGGEANIERIPDERGEVKGIELSVRLPGKRKQSLPLLSGGEKSLTALAFLFAIFKVKPAPFYVLDEVDAALDEENVVKFGELLGEEADFAQFIVITHNKETMQKADMLYGITMEEDGISKVISLKLV